MKEQLLLADLSPLYIEDGRKLIEATERSAMAEALGAYKSRGVEEVFIYAGREDVPKDLIRACKDNNLTASHVQPVMAAGSGDFSQIKKNHGAILSRLKKHGSLLLHIWPGDPKELTFFISGISMAAHPDMSPADACVDALGNEDGPTVEALTRYATFLHNGTSNGSSNGSAEGHHHQETNHATSGIPEAPIEVHPSTGETHVSEMQDHSNDHAANASASLVEVKPAAVPAKAPPAPAKKKEPSPQREIVVPSDFKASKVTIKVKMLGIISAIIIAALSAMILLASYFFRNETKRSIEGANFGVTEIIGSRVQSELETISYKSHLVATTLEQGQAPDQRTLFIDLFFKNNPNFVFIGVARRAGDLLTFGQTVSNDKFLKDNSITPEDIQKLHDANGKALSNAFGGATIIHNASPGFKMPLLGLSVPLAKGNTIVVAYIEPTPIIKTFQNTLPGTTAFLVNDTGDVIAHPDSKLVFSRTNLSDLEIVKIMLESKVDTGQTRYKDKTGEWNLGAYKKLGIGGLGVISSADESKVFAAVGDIQRRNIYIMVIVLALAFIVVYFFAKTLTVPIVKLVGATQQIEQGDYALDIKPKTHDEVGVLTHSFVKMAVGLEEREKLKDAMGKFTNPEIAEMVLRGEMKLGGERKDAAIFFSDLRGFTAMSENMEPEEVVEFLNEYFTEMVRCVDVTGGVVDKFIGDAVMAHWGALFSRGNDTELSINAAIMMRRALIEFNNRATTRSGKKKPIAVIGCGINFGPVISGQIGSETRLDYTVIGDAVNLASRVESLNKPFATDILITTDAYEQVKDIFLVEEMPAIKVKGKSEAQIIYAVLGRKDDPESPQTIKEMRALVGIKFDEEKAAKMADAASGEGEVKYEVIGDKSKESH